MSCLRHWSPSCLRLGVVFDRSPQSAGGLPRMSPMDSRSQSMITQSVVVALRCRPHPQLRQDKRYPPKPSPSGPRKRRRRVPLRSSPCQLCFAAGPLWRQRIVRNRPAETHTQPMTIRCAMHRRQRLADRRESATPWCLIVECIVRISRSPDGQLHNTYFYDPCTRGASMPWDQPAVDVQTSQQPTKVERGGTESVSPSAMSGPG